NGGVHTSASVLVRRGSELVVRDLIVEDSGGTALYVVHKGSVLDADGLLIRGTQAVDEKYYSGAVGVLDQARATIRNAALDRNVDVGIGAERQALVVVEDAVINRSSSARIDSAGNAVTASEGAQLTLIRTRIAASRVAGIRALTEVKLSLQDVVIAGDPMLRPEFNGLGLATFGSVEARNVAIHGVALAGVYLAPGSSSRFEQLRVTGVRRVDGEHGHGFASDRGASSIVRSQFDRNAGAALLFSGGATAQITSTSVSRNNIGIHAQLGSSLSTVEEGALSPGEVRVSEDTRFIENVSRIGTGVIPLPSF
ncbi:MAG: hypothetical protein ACK4N5_19430, partial [Myxococcales bacterium]